MLSPKPTVITPKRMYGTTLSFLESLILTKSSLDLSLCVFSASARLVLMALLIGNKALSVGTTNPITSAWMVAEYPGRIDGWIPISLLNSYL